MYVKNLFSEKLIDTLWERSYVVIWFIFSNDNIFKWH